MLAVLLVIVLFLIEIAVPMPHTYLVIIEVLHVVSIAILSFDLLGRMAGSRNKLKFIKRNAMLIISLFPLGSMFVSVGNSARAGNILRLSTKSTQTVEMALSAFRPVVKSTTLKKHLSKNTAVNVYIEPGVNPLLVKGIFMGIRSFCKKQFRARLEFTKQPYSDLIGYRDTDKDVHDGEALFRHFQGMESSAWNVIITSTEATFNNPKKVFGQTRRIGNNVVSVFNTNKLDSFSKSILVGYHNLTHLLEKKCPHKDCVHNLRDVGHLCALDYIYRKFGELPVCFSHSFA